MHYLVTGGCGFIGSNYIRQQLSANPALRITNLDALTYAGNPASLADVARDFPERYHFIKGDIADQDCLEAVFAKDRYTAVLNFAAESHVDRSIDGPGIFVRTNVTGAYQLAEKARVAGVPRFLQVSTDEVYGSLGADGYFTETTPLCPSSPYSASKAAADLLILANHHTFGQDVVVTRCSNNYGPCQYPEKLIPLMIIRALHGESLPVYGDGGNVRDWIHVEDHCAGIQSVLVQGRSGQVYNLGASSEWRNIDIVKLILRLLGRPESLITFVKDRPGHDRRYAIDSAKARTELGWTAARKFDEAIEETIGWYLRHEEWWRLLLRK
ncbi:MAG: dTDP-glucose 4,6-dehydratase [Verrucomicrobiales bacterium]|nr:dTDP-glucose 4,6-dehydratase [Verrucomicrobiales bacterium]